MSDGAPFAIPDLEGRLRVDTSEVEPVHLLVTRSGAYVRLSPSALELLRHVHGGSSFSDLAERINRRRREGAAPVSTADVEAAYTKIVTSIRTIEENADKPRGPFWLRKRLIPAPWVGRVSAPLSIAFHPLVAIPAVALVLAGAAAAMRFDARVDHHPFLWGYLLFLVSLFAHEFGHSSACARYGAKPGEIGFTFYLIYPAFYSNVSAAWTLKRWQRVVVDLGGVYFQLVVGAAYALAYTVHPWDALRIAVWLVAGSCLFSLNPILRFDGYWVVADALGVTNLSNQPSRVLAHLAARLRGLDPKPLPWRSSTTLVLTVYSVVTFGFWTYFIARTVPFVARQAAGYAATVAALASQIAAAPPWPDGAAIERFLTSTYVLAFAGFMLSRILRAVVAPLKARAARSRQRAATAARATA